MNNNPELNKFYVSLEANLGIKFTKIKELDLEIDKDDNGNIKSIKAIFTPTLETGVDFVPENV